MEAPEIWRFQKVYLRVISVKLLDVISKYWHLVIHQSSLESTTNILYSGSPNTAPKKCPVRMLWLKTGSQLWQFNEWSRFIGGLAHLRLLVSRYGVMTWTVRPAKQDPIGLLPMPYKTFWPCPIKPSEDWSIRLCTCSTM